MKTKKLLSPILRISCLLVGLLGLGLSSSQAQIFTRIYDASAGLLPTTSDAIVDQTATGVGEYGFVGTSPTLSGGLMTTSGNGFLTLNNTSLWDGAAATGSTFEFRLRATVASPDAGGANYSTGVIFGDSAGYWDTRIVYGGSGTGAIVSFNGGIQETLALDTTVFNTFRLTISTTGVGTLYVNNSVTASVTLSKIGGAFNQQQIGAYTPAIVDGEAEWDYIQWTNAGAIPPVPEPSTFAILIVSGLFCLLVLRRRSVRV